jgi:hypothetical protein
MKIGSVINKILGVFLILLGLIFLVTPFTPGATWLILIGLELVGFQMLFGDKVQAWLEKQKFWKKKK